MIICNAVVPQILWFKRARTHVPTLFVVSVLINIGMWFERYVIIIARPLARVRPGGLGRLHAELARADHRGRQLRLLRQFFLIFLKLFPVVAIAEVKEIEIHAKAPHAAGGPLMPTLLGVFDRPDQIAAAAQRLRDRGYGDIETYSPAPFPEVDDAVIEKPSRVRLFTLIGGLTGVVTGYALTIWMANDWPIMVGGKPFSSVTPYTIIAFELTILFGVLMTVLGLFVFGRLPARSGSTRATARASRPRSSGSRCAAASATSPRSTALLRDHHATEVSLVEA